MLTNQSIGYMDAPVPKDINLKEAIEQAEGSVMLDKLLLDRNKKYAIVMGNEVKGVQQSVVDNCDMCIEIPQYGTKHSLNVSVTTGIVIWDFFKQLSE
jgi:23S rRNA (guanosine2251-2'-O)-methyltransferase